MCAVQALKLKPVIHSERHAVCAVQALVELGPTFRDEEGVDLSGDAGAVGRLLVTGTKGKQLLKTREKEQL